MNRHVRVEAPPEGPNPRPTDFRYDNGSQQPDYSYHSTGYRHNPNSSSATRARNKYFAQFRQSPFYHRSQFRQPAQWQRQDQPSEFRHPEREEAGEEFQRQDHPSESRHPEREEAGEEDDEGPGRSEGETEERAKRIGVVLFFNREYKKFVVDGTGYLPNTNIRLIDWANLHDHVFNNPEQADAPFYEGYYDAPEEAKGPE